MNKYEAMLILKPDLSDEEKKTLFIQIGEAVSKNNGQIIEVSVWAEKRRFSFPIKKYQEGLYYLMNFSILPEAIKQMRHTYKLNEVILRVLISKVS